MISHSPPSTPSPYSPPLSDSVLLNILPFHVTSQPLLFADFMDPCSELLARESPSIAYP